MIFEISLMLMNLVGFAFLAYKARNISERLSHVVEGQRLSTILAIEPSELKVDPSRFEADKEKLKTRAISALHSERHPQPGTQAYMVGMNSGLIEFIDRKVWQSLEKALARLIVNEDWEAAEDLLEEVIDQL